MKNLLFLLLLFYSFSLSSALASEEKTVTIYARGDNDELPEGYSHATFNAGNFENFMLWLTENLSYPTRFSDAAISGRVMVEFVIGSAGDVEDIDVSATTDKSLSNEVTKMIMETRGMWKPGTDDRGTPIRIKYIFPVDFRLDKIDAGDTYRIPCYNMDDIPENITPPTFKGRDMRLFRQWLHKRVRYPDILAKAGIGGRVMATFVINKKGIVEGIQILEAPDILFAEEVIRVIKTSPKWKPALDDEGNPVNVRLNIPIDFSLH